VPRATRQRLGMKKPHYRTGSTSIHLQLISPNDSDNISYPVRREREREREEKLCPTEIDIVMEKEEGDDSSTRVAADGDCPKKKKNTKILVTALDVCLRRRPIGS
jgi:hypothetical protein